MSFTSNMEQEALHQKPICKAVLTDVLFLAEALQQPVNTRLTYCHSTKMGD